jgi:hypothetical protein
VGVEFESNLAAVQKVGDGDRLCRGCGGWEAQPISWARLQHAGQVLLAWLINIQQYRK